MHKKLNQVQGGNKEVVEKYSEIEDKKQQNIAIQVKTIELDEKFIDKKEQHIANQTNSVCDIDIAAIHSVLVS